MNYSTIFIIAFAAHFAGDWSHHSWLHILLVSLVFAASFTLSWAGIDRLRESRVMRGGQRG